MNLSYKSKKILFSVFSAYMFCSIIFPSNLKLYKRISISDMLFLILFLTYGVLIAKEFTFKEYVSFKIKRLFKNGLVKSMTILFVLMVISTIYAESKSIALNESFRFLTYIFIGALILSEINTKNFIRLIFVNYVMATMVLNIIGIVQYFTRIGISTTVNIVSETFRLEATLGNPNSFGAYLVISIFPCIMLFINEKNKKLKSFYGIHILFTIINLILTYSRNSWLAFGIGLIILTVMYSWKFIIPIILCGSVSLFIPSVAGRIKQFTDMSQNMSRINIWKIALKMIQDHPLRGVGNGNFAVLYDSYVEKYPELWMEYVTGYPTHNSYLKVFSELGIFALVIFLTIIFKITKNIYYLSKNLKSIFKYFYIGFFISLIIMIILNIFDNVFFVPQIASVFWIIVFSGEVVRENITIFNN